MATTSGGLPYPVGTDKVVDGDNAIRSLAEELDGPIYANFTMNKPGGIRPVVGGLAVWDGPKTGTDASVLDAGKSTITLARTGLYRVDVHLGLAANPGTGVSSLIAVDAVDLPASQMYGNTGAAGVFVVVGPVWIAAVAGITKIAQKVTAPLGIYDWTWLRLTYERKNR